MALKAYKQRFYPTEEQKLNLAKTFGCCRYVYNWALARRKEQYATSGKGLSVTKQSAELTRLKSEDATKWLGKVSAVALQQALRHLDTAFTKFFSGLGGYPKFKKKRGEQSASYMRNAFTWIEAERSLTLALQKKPLKIRWSRALPKGAVPSSVTVSMDSAGRYFVSILVEEDIASKPVTARMCGVDLGIKDVVTTSHGEKYGNPRFFATDEKKLAKAQRSLSKKKLGSKNREKARRRVAHIHARIKDRRIDFLHKLTTRLVNENQVIAVESLAVKNMVKNPHLAKAISDVGWGELIRQLEYKAAWFGRTLQKIDRFFPSSKMCSNCEYVLDELSLDVRYWTCPECGTTHDRDINAAANILKEGLRLLTEGKATKDDKDKKKKKGKS